MNDDALEERLATLERDFWIEKGRSTVMERAISVLLIDLARRDTDLLAVALQSLEIERLDRFRPPVRDAFSAGVAEGLLQLRKRIAAPKDAAPI